MTKTHEYREALLDVEVLLKGTSIMLLSEERHANRWSEGSILEARDQTERALALIKRTIHLSV